MKLIGRIFVALLLASGLLACTSKEEVPPPKPEATPPLPPPPAPEPPEPVVPEKAETETPPSVDPVEPRAEPLKLPAETPPVPDSAGIAKPPEPEVPLEDISDQQTPQFAVELRPVEQKQIQMSHGTLINSLELPDEQRKALQDLLANHLAKEKEITGSAKPGSVNLDELQDHARLIAEQKTEVEAKIEELLGPEKYAHYRAYEASETQRTQVGFLKSTIRDIPLSAEQEQNLVKAMVEERETFSFTYNFDDRTHIDPESLSDEAVKKHLEEFGALQAKYLARAKTVLTPKQFEKFQADQESRRGSEELRVLGLVQTYRQAATNGTN